MSHIPWIFEDRPDEVFALPNCADAAQCSFGLISAYTSDARELGNSKDEAEVGGVNGQDTKGIEVAAEREQVSEVLFTCSLPVQSTATHEELVMMPAGTLSLTTASWPTSTTPYTPNFTANLHQGPTLPLPCSISTRVPSKEWCTQCIISSIPIHSLSTTQKRH